ncbi:hypothetical protein CSB11_02125 [Candidatus Campbellbacteria bacterium]|nr:MAG: hypothetical protein CSB11_02125 [Candidatus Campbellbacteria bacterium]
MQIDDINKKKQINYNSDYIANHFGFDFLDIEEKVFKKNILVEDEKVKVLKKFKKDFSSKRVSPLKMFFYKKPILKKSGVDTSLGIDIVNMESAIAEATVIKTAIAILKEEGYTEIKVLLNAIGDSESVKSFKTALSKYYRENKAKLKTVEAKKIVNDPLAIYHNQGQKEYLNEINQQAPNALEFLSENSISHFQEIIEYLENFEIDYVIDDKMYGEKMFFSKIIFKIMAKGPKDKEPVEVAFGGRYDDIAQKTVGKKKISAIGLSLNFNKKNKTKLKLTSKKVNIHLLKIGSTANLKYLDVVDAFSKIKVPIHYDIKEKKISKQIKKALDSNADYSIIIGETEAKKDKALIRKMSDYSQQEVDLKDISSYINKLIK